MWAFFLYSMYISPKVKMSVARKILATTLAQIIGKIGTALIALVTLKILSTYLSVSTLGEYGQIYEYLAIFGSIADMGIYSLLVREMAKREHEKQKLFGAAFTLRLFLTLGAMLVASILAFLIPSYNGTLIPIGSIFAGMATFFVIMSGTVSAILQIAWKMHLYSWALIAGKLVGLLGIIFVTKIFFLEATTESFFWILCSGLFGSFFTFLITALFSRREISIRPSFEKKHIAEIFWQSLPYGIALILGTMYFRMGFLLLGFLLPKSENGICMAEFCGDLESGRYYTAIRMMEVLLLFPIFFMNAVLPVLSKAIAEKSKKISEILSSSFLFLTFLGLPLAVGGILFSRPLTSLIADEKLLSTPFHSGGDTAFEILAIPMFLSFLTTFLAMALISFNDQKKIAWTNGIAVLFTLLLNLILIPKYGLVGAAISAGCSEILILGIGMFFLKKHTSFFPPLVQFSKVFLASLGMGVFAYAATLLFPAEQNNIVFLAILLSSGVIYLGLLFVLKFFSKEMLSLLKKSDPKVGDVMDLREG